MSQVLEAGGHVLWRRRVGLSYYNIEPIVATLDGVVIVLSCMLSVLFYQSTQYGYVADLQVPLGIGLADGTFFVFLSKAVGLYRLPVLFSPERAIGRLSASWFIVILLSVLVLFLLKVAEAQSRGSISCFALFGLAALIFWRLGACKVLRSAQARGAIRGRRVLLIGDPTELESATATCLLDEHGVKEVKRMVLSGEEEPSPHDRSEIAALADRARSSGAEEIVVAIRWSNTALVELIRDSLRASPLPARLIPDHFIKSLSSGGSKYFGGLASIELQRAPLGRTEQCIKHAVDVVLAAGALTFLSPLLLLTALAIKFDSSGPVIFRQRRNGFNGQTFQILKFRTMTVLEDGEHITQARKYDPRVTRIGRLLRRSSIDELPQLINVLKGDMSLVGPRPHALAHDTEYNAVIRQYACRHHVKPGITGWAQVNGFRGETPRLEDMTKRVELDLWYIKNWSLWFDVRILVRTCFELPRSPKSY